MTGAPESINHSFHVSAEANGIRVKANETSVFIYIRGELIFMTPDEAHGLLRALTVVLRRPRLVMGVA